MIVAFYKSLTKCLYEKKKKKKTTTTAIYYQMMKFRETLLNKKVAQEMIKLKETQRG